MRHGFGTAAAKSLGAALALSVGLGLSATPAHALAYIGTFAGNDCLAGCYATQDGVTDSSTSGGSPAIIKFNNGGATESVVPSVTAGDFEISYVGAPTNDLSFKYLADLGDPTIHYVSVKQGTSYALWYDSIGIAADTLYTLDLDLAGFTNPQGRPIPGWSHISFYNTGGGGGGNVPPVPEPATWAMMILGMAAIGASMRRRKQQQAGVRYNFA